MKYIYYGTISSYIKSDDNMSSNNSGNIISDVKIIVDERDPTPKENPNNINVIWINKKTFEWFICIDNTPNKNVWVSNRGNVIKYLDNPIINLSNITQKTEINLSDYQNFSKTTGITFVFYGEGWHTGNYHFFYQTQQGGTGYLNDAYYGNGFTIRKRCSGFSYKYLSSPPGSDKFIAIFRLEQNKTQIDFFKPDTKEKVYTNIANIPFCPNLDKICIYDICGNGGYPLGGIIYKLHIYDFVVRDEQLTTAINRILDSNDENSNPEPNS